MSEPDSTLIYVVRIPASLINQEILPPDQKRTIPDLIFGQLGTILKGSSKLKMKTIQNGNEIILTF